MIQLDWERAFVQAAITGNRDVIIKAHQRILLAHALLNDTYPTDAERDAIGGAYDWAYERGLLPWQKKMSE